MNYFNELQLRWRDRDANLSHEYVNENGVEWFRVEPECTWKCCALNPSSYVSSSAQQRNEKKLWNLYRLPSSNGTPSLLSTHRRRPIGRHHSLYKYAIILRDLCMLMHSVGKGTYEVRQQSKEIVFFTWKLGPLQKQKCLEPVTTYPLYLQIKFQLTSLN